MRGFCCWILVIIIVFVLLIMFWLISLFCGHRLRCLSTFTCVLLRIYYICLSACLLRAFFWPFICLSVCLLYAVFFLTVYMPFCLSFVCFFLSAYYVYMYFSVCLSCLYVYYGSFRKSIMCVFLLFIICLYVCLLSVVILVYNVFLYVY